MVGGFNAVNATFYDKLSYNFIRDIAPVASIIRAPMVMAVNPTVPAKTVPEFIAYAKANPGRITFGSAGVGGSNHLAGELFKFMAGVNMVHVPYRGIAPALNDLLGGQVQVTFASMPSSIEYIKAGNFFQDCFGAGDQIDRFVGTPRSFHARSVATKPDRHSRRTGAERGSIDDRCRPAACPGYR